MKDPTAERKMPTVLADCKYMSLKQTESILKEPERRLLCHARIREERR